MKRHHIKISTDSQNTGQNSLEKALSYLDNGSEVKAIASDAILIQSYLNNGINSSGKPGQITYIENRPAYAAKGFAAFPSKDFPSPDRGDYLPGSKSEEYAIAFAKDSLNQEFLAELISDSLKDPDLKKEQDNLKSFEQEVPSAQPDPLPSTSGNWNPIVVGASIGAAATIIAALIAALWPRISSTPKPNNSKPSATIDQDSVTPTSQIPNTSPHENRSDSSTRRIGGSVRDDSDLNICIFNAEVCLYVDDTPFPVCTTTDRRGNFSITFDHREPDHQIRLVVRTNRYQPYETWISPGQITAIQNIQLTRL